jgi:hypothetical protein
VVLRKNGGTCAWHHTVYRAPRKSMQRGRFFPQPLYTLSAHIEQAIGKLKRVAMRCEETDISYSASALCAG